MENQIQAAKKQCLPPHKRQKMIERSEFDNLLKYSNGFPFESENQIDDLGEILFEPIPSNDTPPFGKERQ